MRPSDLLGGMPHQFEVRTEAEKWKGAQAQTQEAMREQGQVASAALSNNRQLWETNKRLRGELSAANGRSSVLRAQLDAAVRKLEAIPLDVQERATLQRENDQLRTANAALQKLAAGSLMPELDTETLRAELKRIQAQEKELLATGLVPTAEQVMQSDAERTYGPGVRNLAEERIRTQIAAQGLPQFSGLPTNASIAGKVGSEGC